MQFNGKKVRLWLLYANISLFWMSLYAYVPILSTYTASLGAGSALVGTVISSYGFSQMVLRIPLGILSDKLKKRKIFVVAGMALALLSALGLSLSRTPVSLLAFRALAGAAAASWVILTVMLSGYFDQSRAPQIIARATMCNTLGQIIAMFVGGQVAQYLGSRMSFALAVLFGVCALALSLTIVENAPQSKPVSMRELLFVARDRTLLTVSAVALVYQMINQGAALGFTPTFAKGIGATPAQLGALTSVCLFGMLLTSFLASKWLLNFVPARRLILCGLLITSTCTLAIPLLGVNVGVITALQFCAGLGNGFTYPLLMGMAIAGVPAQKRGVAMGFFQSIYALGMFAGPALMGLVADWASAGASIALVACFGYAALAFGFFMLPKR